MAPRYDAEPRPGTALHRPDGVFVPTRGVDAVGNSGGVDRVVDAMSETSHTQSSDTQTPAALTMYTTSWCGYCARLKTALRSSGLEWTEIDIERNPDAAEFVGSVNGGNHVVPTVLYADGTTATNPSITDVKKKLGV